MHVAEQLKSENLTIRINEQTASISELFPNSHKYDRFGFIVNQPLGSLGASLLIQAAIIEFYDTCPERRTTAPMYPEIYVFHVGGRHGDHSSFDFWPPRKEVFVDSGNPIDLMTAIIDRSITRLAIPDVPGGNPQGLAEAPSTWADHSALQHLLTTVLAYRPSGETPDSNVVLESDHPSFEDNVRWTLDANLILDSYKKEPDSIARPGPTLPVDVDRWVEKLTSRMDEIDAAYAEQLLAKRLKADGERTLRRESYRQVDLEETLSLIVGLETKRS